MRLFIKPSLVALAIAMLPLSTQARSLEEENIYAFGYSTNLNDTTLFLTSIQVLPGATLTKKEGFLEHRNTYGNQLKAHLEGIYPGREACAIFFSKKKSALEKKYLKIRNHLMKVQNTRLTELSAEEFQFKAIVNE